MIRELGDARRITPQFLSLPSQLDRDLRFPLPLMLDDKCQGGAMLAVMLCVRS